MITTQSRTQLKAAYVLLTSASLHASHYRADVLLSNARAKVAEEMTLDELVESINLVEMLVYPRFAKL